MKRWIGCGFEKTLARFRDSKLEDFDRSGTRPPYSSLRNSVRWLIAW